MKLGTFFSAIIISVATLALANAQGTPPVALGDYFTKGEGVVGQIVNVVQPDQIAPYVKKIETAAAKNPEVFREIVKKAKPGEPVPFDERLGFTKEEYDKYLEAWDNRIQQPLANLGLKLESIEKDSGKWKIEIVPDSKNKLSIDAVVIGNLTYNPEDDSWTSLNGRLTRIEDISTGPRSSLGEWKGREWKFDQTTTLSRTRENIAIGALANGQGCYLIYRLQDFLPDSSQMISERSFVIRFPSKAMQAKKKQEGGKRN